MKTRLHFIFILLALFASVNPLFAQGTAFTYQGRLNSGGATASGSYDLTFTLFNVNAGGVAIAGPVTNSAVSVTNGLFTTLVDFGNAFTGASNWLEIAVSTNGANSFTKLAPRQQLTPAPYAIYTPNAGVALIAGSANSVLAGNISGTLPLAQLPASVITNGASGVNITGTFSGNGAGITGVDLRSVNTLGVITFTTNYGNFVLASTPGVGDAPNCVVAADVNGDGKVDLISANSYDSTLTVLTNNGSGSFGSNATLNVGNEPVWVVAADVNGDGKLDLISANYYDSTLTVLTNNGSGGFGSNATLNVGLGPVSVVAADVNGDGKVDLISANGYTNTLTVLTNNGRGGFGFNATLNVGGSPNSVVAADVNGDGKLDLISANANTNTLTVLTNNGSGGFVLSATLTVGNIPDQVIAADVNGDGKVDLITANEDDNTLTVLTNNGSGGFVLAATLTVGNGATSVAAADVNEDGKLDLISANYIDSTLTVLTNDGSGGFVLAATLNVGNTLGDTPYDVVAADVNGDGMVDLISANVDGYGSLTVLTNSTIFTGAGGGLTGLNANNISSGTVPDARLSANVALRAGGNTFSGNQIFTNSQNRFIYLNTPTYPIEVETTNHIDLLALDNSGNLKCLGAVYSGSIKLTSDRNLKENFTALNPQTVLAKVASLPLTEWNYKSDSQTIQHIGPMAQDFHAAFKLDGTDDQHISVVDEGGVALAAIQGLNQKLNEKDAEIQALEKKLDELQATVKQLAAKK
jgi:hypothetical protein